MKKVIRLCGLCVVLVFAFVLCKELGETAPKETLPPTTTLGDEKEDSLSGNDGFEAFATKTATDFFSQGSDGVDDPEYIENDEEESTNSQSDAKKTKKQANIAKKIIHEPNKKKKTQFTLMYEYEVVDDVPISLAFSNHRTPVRVGKSSFVAIATAKGRILIYNAEGILMCDESANHNKSITSIGFTGKDSLKGSFLLTADEEGNGLIHKLKTYKEYIDWPGSRKKKSIKRFSIPVSSTLHYNPLSRVLYIGSYDRYDHRQIISVHEDGFVRKFTHEGHLIQEVALSESDETDIKYGVAIDGILISQGLHFDFFHLRYDNKTRFSCNLV